MTALGPSQSDRPPYGLWSLWDMLEFKSEPFIRALTAIGALQGILQSFESQSKDKYRLVIDGGTKTTFLLQIQSLREAAVDLELTTTLIPIDRVIKELEGDSAIPLEKLLGMTGYVMQLLPDEIRSRKFFALNASEASFFEPNKPLLGPDFEQKFMTLGAFELEEAAKCLALGRSTAAVFHLMRIMEIGIRAIARCLGIPDPTRPAERNWGHILGEMKKDLDAHGGQAPTKTWAPGDKELFEGAHASLDAVRVAWRNTTMHVEKKYTQEEAEHIFGAVRGFMNHLASRCDENGEPKA